MIPDLDPKVVARFWSKVDKSGDCWLWTRCVNRNGYGRVKIAGFTYLAHRFSYELKHGPIPEGLVVDHLCHTPGCVRPDKDHLRAVTQKKNAENRKGASPKNPVGIRGVTWSKRDKVYVGHVGHFGKLYHVGHFKTAADAEVAVIAKRKALYGQ